MIQLIPQLTVLVCIEPQDFRRGIDSLAGVCRNQLDEDPFSGRLYVFRNRAGTALKMLTYDGGGYWLLLKRFSKGKLSWWPAPGATKLHPIAAHELSVLLYSGNPATAHFAEPWRKIG